MVDQRYAALHKRFFSFLIDALILYTVVISCAFLFKTNYSLTRLMLWAGFLSVPYSMFFWKKTGQTIGSLLLNIKVVPDKMGLVTFKDLVIRSGALFTFIAPLGIIILLTAVNILQTVFWSLRKSPYKEKKQTIWDVASHTCVIEL